MNDITQTQPDKQPPRGQERLVDREARNPWFRWTLHIGAPLSMSLAVHVVFVILFSLTTIVAATSGREEVGDYEAGVTNLADELAGDFKWQEDQLETPEEEKLDDLSSLTDISDLDISDLNDASSTLGDTGIGFGEGRGDILGIGTGAGEAGSGGFGSGFGAGGRAGGGRVGMWGSDIIANKIAYVIDFSGSIIVAQEDLVRELKRSVGQLRPPQAFNVFIFYESSGGRVVTENFAQGGLVIAKDDTKAAFNRWIETKQPQGATEPLQAIREALKAEPEVVFFLSDGFFDEKIVDEITRGNRRVGAKFMCMVFDDTLLSDTSGLPPRPTDGSNRLGRIARQNNGRSKIVTGADLGGR
jgi:hypothetical protein